MTIDSPAAEIRRAADKLDQLAEAATPGPWTAEELPPSEHNPHSVHWVTTEYADDRGTTYRTVADCPWRQADAELIAVMHQLTGFGLWSLLRAVATALDVGSIAADSPVAVYAVHAARAVLGGAS